MSQLADHYIDTGRPRIEEKFEKYPSRKAMTRFSCRPEGYLHLGHARSIVLNFDLARNLYGSFHLRFDDTEPLPSSQEYLSAIQDDIAWLGVELGSEVRFASDHFERLYEMAEKLILRGDAYVDDLSEDQIRTNLGSPYTAGVDSPFRSRSNLENLRRFGAMRSGIYPDATCVLRAKIDMGSSHMKMRDPILYRINHARHPRTGNGWVIYPTNDFALGQCDSLEGVTHTIGAPESPDHRPLYDWLAKRLVVDSHRPHHIEVQRVDLKHSLLSTKRPGHLFSRRCVEHWDDLHLMTLVELREGGVPPEAVVEFVRGTSA